MSKRHGLPGECGGRDREVVQVEKEGSRRAGLTIFAFNLSLHNVLDKLSLTNFLLQIMLEKTNVK